MSKKTILGLVLAALLAVAVALGIHGSASAANGAVAYQGDDYAIGYYHRVYVSDVECDGRPVRAEFYTSNNPGSHRFLNAAGCHDDGSLVQIPSDNWVCAIQVQEQRDDGLWVAGAWKNVADRC